MEKYREAIKNRMITIGAAMLISLAAVGTALSRVRVLPEVSDFMSGFLTSFPLGLLFGGCGIGVWQLMRCSKALKDETELSRLYGIEHDEMTEKIRSSALTTAFFVTSAVLLTASVIAALYNPTICLSLLGALVTHLTIGAICKLYFRAQYIRPEAEDNEEDNSEEDLQ